jgi:hypothetical protein
MSERNGNMRPVWALVGRARPHLPASQLRFIGSTFQLHQREILLAAAGLGELPDFELAQQLLTVARRLHRETVRP